MGRQESVEDQACRSDCRDLLTDGRVAHRHEMPGPPLG